MELEVNRLDFVQKAFQIDFKPLILYDYQREILEDTSSFRYILKSRQTGISTLIAIESIFNSLWRKNHTSVLISKTEDTTREIILYARRLLDSMPEEMADWWLLETESKTEFAFNTGGRFICLANAGDAGRGIRANDVYLDEFAFFNKRERDRDKEVLTSVRGSIVRGGNLTIISTPSGRQGMFYEIYTNPKGWSFHRIPWTRCPELIRQGKEKLLQGLPEPKEILFAQEFECQFVDLLTAFIPAEIFDQCVDPNLKLWVE